MSQPWRELCRGHLPPPGPGEASGCKEEAQGIGAPALGVWGQRAGLSPLGLPSGAV